MRQSSKFAEHLKYTDDLNWNEKYVPLKIIELE